jgi:hypothetical protein
VFSWGSKDYAQLPPSDFLFCPNIAVAVAANLTNPVAIGFFAAVHFFVFAAMVIRVVAEVKGGVVGVLKSEGNASGVLGWGSKDYAQPILPVFYFAPTSPSPLPLTSPTPLPSASSPPFTSSSSPQW